MYLMIVMIVLLTVVIIGTVIYMFIDDGWY